MRIFRFHEQPVSDGTVIEVSADVLCLGIHIDPAGDRKTVVTWLEELTVEEQYEREVMSGDD